MTCGNVDLRCTKCRLSKGRTNVVPGAGDCRARIIFIGEAPGKDEDLKGEPFVGRAGRLLDEALSEAGVSRKDVFISNLVKCRPPDNRRPRKDELSTCTSLYLASELAEVSPDVVCALGQTAAEHVLGKKVKMNRSVGRGTSVDLGGRRVRIFVAYHPAACLYQRKNLAGFKKAIRTSLKAAGLA